MYGYVALILTGHVPYLRAASREPVGEDLLHETIATALVPTLNALFDLREHGIQPTVALAYSPVLLEQLADNIVQKHFVIWMERRIDQLEHEATRLEQENEAHRSYLARFSIDWCRGILHSFEHRYGRNLVNALRGLCSDGVVEPLASAATHAYLPLLNRTESLRAQLDIGTLAVTRLLGTRPNGFWLPECGYTPALEQLLRPSGSHFLIVDPASLADSSIPHLRPRWLAAHEMAVLVRDSDAAQQIMDPVLGYVGDPLYRSPRRDARSGLALWRLGLIHETAQLYDPYDAFRSAQAHAAHFHSYLAAELAAFHMQHDRPGIAVVPLDVDLLGRGWFEGPTWLRTLLETFREQATIELTQPTAYLNNFQPRQEATPREGSWGIGGDHRTWNGRAALPLHEAMSEIEDRLAALIRRQPRARGDHERVLAQALRELLLAQSSDWPALLSQIGNGPAASAKQAAALQRPLEHLRRCERLCTMADITVFSEGELMFLDQVEELDNPFPQINYRVFNS